MSPLTLNASSLGQYEALLKAVRSGDLGATEKFLTDHPEAVKAKIMSGGETALRIAAMFGHFHIVEKLEPLISDDIEFKSDLIITALHCAAFHTNKNAIKTAKCTIEKNEGLVTIPDESGWLPVTLALDYGHSEMARYLYPVTPFEVLLHQNGKNGVEVLIKCYHSKMFDMALDLITRCPRLALMQSRRGLNFLENLAAAPSAFLSEIQLPFWKRWLHTWVHVHHETAFGINEAVINIPETIERRDGYVRRISCGLLRQLVRNTLHLLGIMKVYGAKLAHKQYLELLRAACNIISTLNEEDIRRSRIHLALFIAAQRGNSEFVVEAIKVHLPLVWARTAYGYRWHPFFAAVQFRQAKVFNLIYGFVLKHAVANIRDVEGNCLLHMAGLQAPPTQLNHIPGALLQMQRELQWFKEIESIRRRNI